jgi:hypothetical protein
MPDSHYPHLREVLDSRFTELPDSALESVFQAAFGEGAEPAEYEEFFGTLGRALKAAAPGAIQGAVTGASMGGPWGGLAGLIAGGVGSALAQQGAGPVRDAGRVSGVAGTTVTPAGRPAPQPAAPPLSPLPTGPAPAGGVAGAVPAAAHLLALLQDPRIVAALQMLLQRGSGTVPVGPSSTPVPATEVAGLVGTLALEAAADATAEVSEALPAYLTDAAGYPVVDPLEPGQRAGRLLQLFGSEGESFAVESWDVLELTEKAELDIAGLEEVDDLYEAMEVTT